MSTTGTGEGQEQQPGQTGLIGWLDRRYGIRPLLEFLSHKEVPLGVHSMFWYFLGGATLFFFVVQILSGVLLLMYYQPGENTAYESVRYIATKVPFGWLVRAVHCWSAHLMIICLVVHMFSTFFLKAYRKPRELTWVGGYALFALTLCFGFSGYLLPWNELAYFATTVGTDSVKSVPLVGDWLLQILRGGPDVTINTLYRFFVAHVVILPLTVFAAIAVHLLFIQLQGMAAPVGMKRAPRSMKFFPNFALRDLLLWMFCLLLLVMLAAFLPYGPAIPGMEWELGNKADPLAPAYPGIKPEWYFLWIYQLLKEFPPHILGLEGPQMCLLIVGILLAIWAAVPWLDRAAERDENSPAFTDFGVAAIIFISFLTLKSWDLGGEFGVDDPENQAKVAAYCAVIITALFAFVTGLRAVVWGDRWFYLSAAAALHAALHGLVRLPYLEAGVVAGVLAAFGVVKAVLQERRRAPTRPSA
jgi:cytochrome b6